MRAGLTVAALLLVGSAAAGCASDPGTPSAGRLADSPASPTTGGATPAPADTRLVLVSGRDDHGMVAEERVPLYDRVDGSHVTGKVADATFARVLATDGQWLKVETVEGPRATGWVDDFFLRGEARLVGPAPSCRARLGENRLAGGTLVVVHALRGHRVLVATETQPTDAGWVDRGVLQELPPQGPHCGDIPLDDKHAHTH